MQIAITSYTVQQVSFCGKNIGIRMFWYILISSGVEDKFYNQ